MLVEKTKKLKINENLEVSKFQPQKKKKIFTTITAGKAYKPQKMIVAD